MAIAFNLPSEREATEENFSRLNRLLAELYEVLCHILVSRQPGQEAQETRRDRPFSESDVDRQRPQPQTSTSCRLSASSPPLTLSLDGEMDDDVFVNPRSETGNDLFSTRNLEIFGLGSTRTPAGVLLTPQGERSFTFSVTSEKQWRDKGGTSESEAPTNAANTDTDVTDAAPTEDPADPNDREESPETSIFSSIIPDKVAGSICTAILLMLGWKLLSKR